MGPISPSSLAALRAPQPGSASRAGALLQLAIELEDRAGEAAAAADELAGDPYLDALIVSSEPPREPVEPHGPVERSGGESERGVELVQVPAQPLLRAPALVDEIVAMIDE